MTSDDPGLIEHDALRGTTVGFSVSNSADLARLGLDDRHSELAVGELARAVLLAGGTIVYGGRLRPSGYTQQLMNEVRRFGASHRSLTLCVAYPEHAELRPSEIDELDRQLGTWGELITLDALGQPVRWQDRDPEPPQALSDDERASAYSGLRRYMADHTNARILVGGQLRGFKGSMPGVIEEAILAIERSQPIYPAGGFGGAAAAVANALHSSPLTWLPSGLPEGVGEREVEVALDQLKSTVSDSGWSGDIDGLSDEDRALLCATHRPGEIASLCVIGLAHWSAANRRAEN